MNRLTSNDRNFGPFTIARWKNTLKAEISSGDEEDPECTALFVLFGWALRILLPPILKPTGKYGENRTEYGITLSKQEGSWDFLEVYYGAQSNDGNRRAWTKFLPWTQWNFLRNSIYRPDGSHFADEQRTKGSWNEFYEIKKTCPKSYFEFIDFDGARIIATCMIEEREWSKGVGSFKWLKYFTPNLIRRSLNLEFSEEVGKGKGSWKGGTLGHGIDMQKGESPEAAFKRYCSKPHRHKYGDSELTFVGPCAAPPEKVYPVVEDDDCLAQVYKTK